MDDMNTLLSNRHIEAWTSETDVTGDFRYINREYFAISQEGKILSFYLEYLTGPSFNFIDSKTGANLTASELKGYIIYYVIVSFKHAGKIMKKKKYLKRSLPTNFKSADQFNEPGGTFITLGKNKIKNNLNDYNNYSVENRWWKKILTKGKNILVIIFESQGKDIEDREFEYEIDITRDDISGLEIDISGIIIDPDEVDKLSSSI